MRWPTSSSQPGQSQDHRQRDLHHCPRFQHFVTFHNGGRGLVRTPRGTKPTAVELSKKLTNSGLFSTIVRDCPGQTFGPLLHVKDQFDIFFYTFPITLNYCTRTFVTFMSIVNSDVIVHIPILLLNNKTKPSPACSLLTPECCDDILSNIYDAYYC